MTSVCRDVLLPLLLIVLLVLTPLLLLLMLLPLLLLRRLSLLWCMLFIATSLPRATLCLPFTSLSAVCFWPITIVPTTSVHGDWLSAEEWNCDGFVAACNWLEAVLFTYAWALASLGVLGVLLLGGSDGGRGVQLFNVPMSNYTSHTTHHMRFSLQCWHTLKSSATNWTSVQPTPHHSHVTHILYNTHVKCGIQFSQSTKRQKTAHMLTQNNQSAYSCDTASRIQSTVDKLLNPPATFIQF